MPVNEHSLKLVSALETCLTEMDIAGQATAAAHMDLAIEVLCRELGIARNISVSD